MFIPALLKAFSFLMLIPLDRSKRERNATPQRSAVTHSLGQIRSLTVERELLCVYFST